MKRVIVPHLRQLSSSAWKSRTNVVITNPTLLIMESCSNMQQLKQIQAHMTLTGLITHTFPLSRVLAFCALSDQGDFLHARLLFHHFPNPNTYMCNTMIRGSLHANVPSIAFSFFFLHMLRRHQIDCRTFVFVLKACHVFTGFCQGESVHCVVLKMGFDSELLVRNGLIHFYAAVHGSFNDARKVFDECSDRDVVTWTTMIDGYAALHCSDAALELFNLMLVSGVEPNQVTLIAVLKACSLKGDLEMGKSVHENIEKNKSMRCGLSLHNALLDMYVKCGCLTGARELFDRMGTRDVYSWTSLVNGYAKCGDLESARSFFDRTPQKNAVSWSAMIAGYSQNNKPNESLKLFHEMIGAGMVVMDHTLVSVLSACGKLSCLSLGHWIHEYFVNGKRMHLSVTLGNAVIDMYAKCGSIDAAAQVFSSMSEKNLVSWNSMIAGYAANGRAKEAVSLFDQMRYMGFKPDDITFVSLLTACSHGGLILEGQDYFDSMERNYGLKPKREHYACMIDLLGRNGLLEEAYVLITNMPMQPSEAAWGALLNACRMHGNVELAKLSSCNLLSLDPDDSGIYVLLANICANEKKWADVKRVRSLMREKGVKKIPGHSLIEIEGEFKEFLVADESHPQSEEIYKVLDEMFLLSKLEDFDCEV